MGAKHRRAETLLGCVAFAQRGARQMKIPGLNRWALTTCAAAATLTGCGGSQPPIGMPGAMPQSRAITTHTDRGASWMSADAKGKSELLYVSDGATNDVYVYDYPKGTEVGKLTGFNYPDGQCVDAQGDVYITNFDAGTVLEYAHGGTIPIKTLETNGYPIGCSVSSAGDLAVANFSTQSGPGNVLVFKDASGTPTAYSDPSECYYVWPPGYDAKGNLFAEGEYSSIDVCWVPVGGKSMSAIGFGAQIYFPGSVMWGGKYLIFADQDANQNYETGLYAATLSGSYINVIGSVTLTDACTNDYADVAQPFLVGNANTPVNKSAAKIVVGGNLWCKREVGSWDFLQGKNPSSLLHEAPKLPYGQSVSIGEQSGLTGASASVARTSTAAPSSPALKTPQPLAYVAAPNEIMMLPETPAQHPIPIATITEDVTFPWGLFVDAKRSLYVANEYGGTVVKYKSGTLRPSATYAKDLDRPLYPLVDGAGDLFVSNANNGTVVEYPVGHVSHPRVLQTDGTEADGMDFDSQGNLYVAYRGGVYGSSIDEFTHGLKRHHSLGMNLGSPQGLAVDSQGTIVVVEDGPTNIEAFAPGSKTPEVTISTGEKMTQLVLDQQEDSLYVSSVNGIVYRLAYPLAPSESLQIESNAGQSIGGLALTNGQTF